MLTVRNYLAAHVSLAGRTMGRLALEGTDSPTSVMSSAGATTVGRTRRAGGCVGAAQPAAAPAAALPEAAGDVAPRHRAALHALLTIDMLIMLIMNMSMTNC